MVLARLVGLGEAATHGTGFSRLQLYGAILQDGLKSPLIGQGASAYREVAENLGISGSVAENFAVEFFHSSGLIGLGALLVGILLELRRALRAIPADESPWRLAVLGLTATVLIGALSNPSFWNGTLWCGLALIGCARRIQPPTPLDPA